MSVVPGGLPGARPKSSVTILGRQVSTDALLVAGASLVAVILLYRAGKPASAQQPLSLSGDGSTLAPSNAMIASTPPVNSTSGVLPVATSPAFWQAANAAPSGAASGAPQLMAGPFTMPNMPVVPGTGVPGFREG